MAVVHVIGAGPAGCSAAISAALDGAQVVLHEKSRLPRHKVCGEFLSPEVIGSFERMGVLEAFDALHPAAIRRLRLHIGRRSLECHLPEPGFGLSRFALDEMLLTRARRLGAKLSDAAVPGQGPLVLAMGRGAVSKQPLRSRLFGFKSHYAGQCDDAVELFFSDGCYVGINAIENGFTNVCGLGPQRLLDRWNFDMDSLVQSIPALANRLSGLSRTMPWMTTGPLVFKNHFKDAENQAFRYLAGDALSFVDPFTGSGILSGLLTGELAGRSAVAGRSTGNYLAGCAAILQSPFTISSVLRNLAGQSWVEYVVPWVPARWLFSLTRPRLTKNRWALGGGCPPVGPYLTRSF